jgi:glycine oxidase
MDVTVIGAGVAGLTCALELARGGARVEVLERAASPGRDGCSWYAGGMLAPWCEREDGTEPLITRLGIEGLGWWRENFAGLRRAGTLVVAGARDAPELLRFAQRTDGFRSIGGQEIAALEPQIAGRFEHALYFPEEAHLDPREVLPQLAARVQTLGGTVHYGRVADGAALERAAASRNARVIDCRGLMARDTLSDLRGVRGEMLLVRSREIRLRRPVRLLHPRVPVYIIPRADGIYMIGATAIESDDVSPVTVRSALELLSAAYAVHPAFGEAQILEFGAQARPAFADNLPRIRRHGATLYVNGLYRHGFLIAPALAGMVAQSVLHDRHFPEVSDEDSRQRRLA